MPTTLPIQAITRDERCQPRGCFTRDAIDRYAEEMAKGAIFPPVIVFHDGQTHWLADGFHRVAAAEQAGLDVVNCEIREGTFRDAMLYSVGTNATHGLQRTNYDKHRAVETLTEDPEWSQWSNREIARRCAVSHTFVQNFKNTLATLASERSEREAASVKYTDRWGNESTMSTENIGRSSRPSDPAEVRVELAYPPKINELARIGKAVQPKTATRVQQSQPITIDPGPDIDDGETWETLPPATPAKCQAVASALESLFTAMERADGERIDFADVVKYVMAEADEETRDDFVVQARKLADDMVYLRTAIIETQAT